MENKSSITRWLVALWLISSQIAGAALVFAPLVVLISFRALGTSEADPTAFNILLWMGYIFPFIFIAVAITSWFTFAWRKDGIASLFSLAGLFPGAILLFGMKLYVP